MNFKVGDKTYISNRHGDSYTAVTIVSISPKRGDIKTIDSNKNERIFGSNGWLKTRDIWNTPRLLEPSPELTEKIFKIKNIRYVSSLLDSFIKQKEFDMEDILMLKQVIRSTNWFKSRKVE